MPSPIVNESTSVIRVDSSGLQNGQVNIVYISSTTIPGQLVSVVDATGFTSSPQRILMSTVGDAQFTDGTSSTSITQRFGYLTLVSQDSSNWAIVNRAAFSNPLAPAIYQSVDAGTVNTYTTQISGLLSTGSAVIGGITVASDFIGGAASYTSTLYVNAVSSFLATRPNDFRTTVIGNEYISGALVVAGGATSFRESISAFGDLFTTGNISSKNGTIYFGGGVNVSGSIRGQRGFQMTANFLSTFATSGFVGPVIVTDTVTSGNAVRAREISTSDTFGTTMNIASSILFRDAYDSLVNHPHGLEMIGLNATIPSTVSTLWLTASSITTSNLTVENFAEMPSLTYLTLGSTLMTNANGSFTTSTVQGNSMTIAQTIQVPRIEEATELVAQGIEMNDSVPSGDIAIHFGPTVYDISGYWVISSIAESGTMNAPYTTLSTIRILSHGGTAAELHTFSTTIQDMTVGSVIATEHVDISGISTLSMKNVFFNNSLGSILGSVAQTIQEIHCSSIFADQVSTGVALQFLHPVTGVLKDTFISSLNSGTATTSSLFASQITTGLSENYSTINPSTPWLITSTFQMNTGPFMKASGLGTFFEHASFLATSNETTYYSIVNPIAQEKVYLSTPYVNTIAGTGTPGTVQNGEVAFYARLGSQLSQLDGDTEGNVFVGSKDLGWKVQQITPGGSISTLAGNYRYFYGDGQYPLGAAFATGLAVSISPIGQINITDISNVRIRTIGTDPITVTPIIQTIVGTGASAFSGDEGLAYLAALSSPTASATDMSGTLYIADTGNNVIRYVVGSTISTFAGTPGVPGNTGDGGPALQATLTSPFGIVADLSNNIFFTDVSNCVIRGITPGGIINLLAGSYVSGFGGDGGPATSALLSTPRGIAMDANSNIFFCDTGNSRVRRVDMASQIITTVAGNGISGYGGDGGLAVNANLSTPTGVAVDAAGNVYISDTDNQCIRYLNMANNRITTVAGRPTRQGYGGDNSFATFALLNSPSHIAVDPTSGFFYFADDGNYRVRYVDPTMKIIYSAAGNGSPVSWGDGGPAVNAVFGSIASLTRDTGSNLYIVDDTANTVRVIDLSTMVISAVAGTGVGGYTGDGGLATQARISTPQQLVIGTQPSTLYFTERDSHVVRSVSSGTITTIAGTGVAGYSGDSTLATTAELNSPVGLAIDTAGSLYVADTNNARIREITSSIITTYAGSGIYGSPTNNMSFASTTLGSTMSLTVNANRQLYLTDFGTNAIWTLNLSTQRLQNVNTVTTGGYLGDAGPLSNAHFSTPVGLRVDPQGNLLIADQGNSRVRQTYTFGFPQTPVYITMNFNYTNYFASTGTARISLNGNVIKTFSGSNAFNDSFSLTDANIYTYPLQGVNPVYADQTPYVEITQSGSTGYTKLEGTLFLEEFPYQGMLQNSVVDTAGIQMNAGFLSFPNTVNGITIDNRFNDVSTRTIVYSGQLYNSSDPGLKENCVTADPAICCSTIASIPLKRYRYNEAYMSTFRVRDTHRLGLLTTDVQQVLPKSITTTCVDQSWAPSTQTLDPAQIRFSHYGVTQHLLALVSTLEAQVEIAAQRNSLLS